MTLNSFISVEEERVERLSLWHSLIARDLTSSVPEGFASKELLLGGGRLYSPGRGIWRDKARLSAIPDAPEGITVSILQTGNDYQDEVDATGIMYRYPFTRQRGADAGDIIATKSAARFDLPIFVVSTVRGTADRRNIRLGWVAGADDEAQVFDIRFDKPDGQPGDWVSSNARFQFDAIRNNGGTCAVCGASDRSRLSVVPLIPPNEGGTDTPDNGIVLCGHHAQMLERGMFRIDPASTRIVPRDGLTNEGLTIRYPDLSHLKVKPSRDALERRWGDR